jgi:uncharacterized ion transporter superfamily protein YfcC
MSRLTGVSGQTTELAYLIGNGLTNMVTPTSGMLLACSLIAAVVAVSIDC